MVELIAAHPYAFLVLLVGVVGFAYGLAVGVRMARRVVYQREP